MTVVAVLLSVWLVSVRAGLVSERRFGPTRQTHPVWARSFGRAKGAFLWGVDLGSGLTTRSTYQSYWLLPISVLLIGRPGIGALSFACFALARSIPVVLGPKLPSDGLGWAASFRRRLEFVDVVCAVVAVTGVASAVVQWVPWS